MRVHFPHASCAQPFLSDPLRPTESHEVNVQKIAAHGLFRAVAAPNFWEMTARADLVKIIAAAREKVSAFTERIRMRSAVTVKFNTVHTLLMNMQMWLVPEAGGE